MNKYIFKRLFIFIIIFAIGITGLILYFKTDIFKTKRSAFLTYIKDTTNFLDVFKLENFDQYNNSKYSKNYTRKGKVSITSSQNIAEPSILDKIELQIDEIKDNSDKKMYTNCKVKYDSGDVEEANFIKIDDIYGFFCQDVSNSYICLENSNIQNILPSIKNVRFTDIPEIFENKNQLINISKQEKAHIEETFKAFSKNVDDKSFTKTTKEITIDESKFNTSVYEMNLDSNNMKKAVSNTIDYVTKDSIMMNFITSKLKLLSVETKYTDVNSLSQILKEYNQNIKDNKVDMSGLNVKFYINKKSLVKIDIEMNNNKISIEYLENDNNENKQYLSIIVNGIKYEIKSYGKNVDFSYEDEANKNIWKIEYNQAGDIDNNNIQNIAQISHTNGTKKISFAYNDSVKFTDDINKISDINKDNIVLLNNYEKNDVEDFIKALKKKVNEVYVNKASQIGINVDPLFEVGDE